MGDLEGLRHREAFGLGEFSSKAKADREWKFGWVLALCLGVAALFVAFVSYVARESGKQERRAYYLWVEYTGCGDISYDDWQTLRTYNSLPGTVLPVESN